MFSIIFNALNNNYIYKIILTTILSIFILGASDYNNNSSDDCKMKFKNTSSQDEQSSSINDESESRTHEFDKKDLKSFVSSIDSSISDELISKEVDSFKEAPSDDYSPFFIKKPLKEFTKIKRKSKLWDESNLPTLSNSYIQEGLNINIEELAKVYSQILDSAISSINTLSTKEAHDLYIIIMFLKYKIYTEYTPLAFRAYIEKKLNFINTSEMLDSSEIDTILGIDESSSFIDLLKTEKQDCKSRKPRNYTEYLIRYRDALQQYYLVISGLNFTKKQQSDNTFDIALSLLEDASKKIEDIFTFTEAFRNLHTEPFSKFKLKEFTTRFDMFEIIGMSIFYKYHTKLFKAATDLVDKASLKDFESLLYSDKAKRHDLFQIFNVDKNLDFSENKLFITLLTHIDFIKDAVKYITDNLKIDLKIVSIEETKEKIEKSLEEIFRSYFRKAMDGEDITSLNINSKYYSKDLISLILTLIYWSFNTPFDKSISSLTQLPIEYVTSITFTHNIYKNLNNFNKNILCWYFSDVLNKYFINELISGMDTLSTLVLSFSGILINESSKTNNQIDEIRRALNTLYQQQIYKLPEFIGSFLNSNEDINMTSALLYITLTDPKYLDIVQRNIHIDISSKSDRLSEIFKAFVKFPDSTTVLKNFIYILARETKNINDLNIVLDLLLKYNLTTLQSIYFSNLNIELLQENIENLNYESVMSSFITKVYKLDKLHINAKKIIASVLLKKESLSSSEIEYLIHVRKNLGVNDSSVINKLSTLKLEDTVSVIARMLYTNLPGAKETLIKHLIDTNTNEFSLLTLQEIKIITLFLISNTSTKGAEDKIIRILDNRSDLKSSLIEEVSNSSFLSNEMSLVKDFLISNKYMKKPPKIKRELVKKVQIDSVDQGTIKASDVQLLIQDIIDNQNLESTVNIVELLNQLEIESKKTSNINNGKRSVKELQKSLDLILKMFENFTFDKYPLVKQIFYSRLSFDSFMYLVSNISNYRLKNAVYSILIYWIDNNIINLSNLDQISEIISDMVVKKIFTSQQIYRLCVRILNISGISINVANKIISILIDLIKSNTKIDSESKFLTISNIIEDYLPIISKQLDRVESLRELIREKIKIPYTSNGINSNGSRLIKFNLDLISYISTLPLFKKLILISILPKEALLYIKNSNKDFNYSDLIYRFKNLIKETKNSTTPSYIKELAQSVINTFDTILDLNEEIQNGIKSINNWSSSDFDSERAISFREKISLYQTLLYEIELGFIPVNLSHKDYIGLGYDILSISRQETKLIEVKSKWALFSVEFPPSISLNEARVALNSHKEPSNGSYHIYLIPLNINEREKYGELIEMDINWSRLEYQFESMKDPEYDNPNYYILDSDRKIFLKDFTNNLYVR